MDCVGCGSAAVTERPDLTAQGYRRFWCRECGTQFNERSGSVLNRASLPSDIIAFVVFCVIGAKSRGSLDFLACPDAGGSFGCGMPPSANLSGLSRAELESQFVELLGEVSELKQIVMAQRDEIARLKGLKGRPPIKPSGMENATGLKRGGKRVKRRRRGKVTSRVVPETEVLRVAHPTGSQFKGYEPYQVQELVLTARVVRYRRERWLTPQGETIVAPLPGGIRGHFGPELRRFVLMQYHQGQVTVERLVAQLQAIGVSISKRQLMRLLIDRQDDFLTETREVLRAGLETADWITVDDTGARHRGANGVCTQIGNDNFAWFGTTDSKSRLNFLDLLRAGHTDYTINDTALEYMRVHALAGTPVQRLAAHKRRQFADEPAWTRHLERLGIAGLAVTPDPVRVATEGALWGAVNAHGFLCEAVVVSDDAGQFNLGQHALCWIHAERLVHKLETFTDPPAWRAAACPRADLVGLCRPEGLPARADAASTQ